MAGFHFDEFIISFSQPSVWSLVEQWASVPILFDWVPVLSKWKTLTSYSRVLVRWTKSLAEKCTTVTISSAVHRSCLTMAFLTTSWRMISMDACSHFAGFPTCLKQCDIRHRSFRAFTILFIVWLISFQRRHPTTLDIWFKDDTFQLLSRSVPIMKPAVPRWHRRFNRVSSIGIHSSRSWRVGQRQSSVDEHVSVESVSVVVLRVFATALCIICSF